jgi:hypothetical protein
MSRSLNYAQYYRRSKRLISSLYISYFIILIFHSFYLLSQGGMVSTVRGIPLESRAHCAAYELALERRPHAFPEQAPGSVHPAFDRPDGNPYDVCSRFVG